MYQPLDIDAGKFADENALLDALTTQAALSPAERQHISRTAAALVEQVRNSERPGLLEAVLATYSLSTEGGVALMGLAEALLRVPDPLTADALIHDKITGTDWRTPTGGQPAGQGAGRGQPTSRQTRQTAEREPGQNAGQGTGQVSGQATRQVTGGEARPATGKSTPLIVRALSALLAATRATLLATDRSGAARRALGKTARPAIRLGAATAMRWMGRQFVLGETIAAGLNRARTEEARGYTYSYDMLGEAALTAADAERARQGYAHAINAIAARCRGTDFRTNPGISIKLSALHPRYEWAQAERVMTELVPVVRDLARQAARAHMHLTIDAEEADRLALSLDVIEAVMSDASLAGWDGFGAAVQAYGRRAGTVIERLSAAARRNRQRITIRLVKGAYWDTEIKHAQVQGLDDFPVFTTKAASDVSYIAHARSLLALGDHIYPQFATHNAHTITAILHMAEGRSRNTFEFQRLHGMGERVHEAVLRKHGTRCRIYAPVGSHRELLPYLVRRLLENGANASFVNQMSDESVTAGTIARCPFEVLETLAGRRPLTTGRDLFSPQRRNSTGHDLSHAPTLERLLSARTAFRPENAGPIIAGGASHAEKPAQHIGAATSMSQNPATGDGIASVRHASTDDVQAALGTARPWNAPADERARILNRAADLFEEDTAAFFALLAHEGGKTLPDAEGELREAVDFLRYYAAEALKLERPARGVFACISPWNFPLAIFTGQIAAALAAGNGVLAKPAEQTPLVAAHAVRLLLRAGVPETAMQYLPGPGSVVGAAITADPRIGGVAFTGSTETARHIRRTIAGHLAADTPLIAETGGLNAMIIDSTALPEQAVRDVIASAFRSAGQRCSALRCLYVQEDVADTFIRTLCGAMDELRLGDPWRPETDIGPLINMAARDEIAAYVDTARREGRLIRQLDAPTAGSFLGPALIRVNGIADLTHEVFGPVLHVATYPAHALDDVIAAINATGYGLTFGLHTRIGARIETVARRIHAGNAYVNRNMIGAVVGSQPFGGEGLSGTGPKAGGPAYLPRFTRPEPGGTAYGEPAGAPHDDPSISPADAVDIAALQRALSALQAGGRMAEAPLPGPTGETNLLALFTRPPILCLGPGAETAERQAAAIRSLGGLAVAARHRLEPDALISLRDFSGIIWWGDYHMAAAYARALAARDGPILPLIAGLPDIALVAHERHLCIDTTAAGGNAQLLAGGA